MADQRIAPLAQRKDTVQALLLKYKPQINLALPRHMTADRMLRVAMTAMNQTPKLWECTDSSLVGAVIQASQLGLEPDGFVGMAYLIPYRNSKKNVFEAHFLPGYKGLMTLARRSGEVKQIEPRIVQAGDRFLYEYGLKPKCVHVPKARPAGADATPTHAYVVVTFADGDKQFDVMTTADIETIRAQSRAANDGPWVTHWAEMAKKTVIRRICKSLPVSIEVQRAVALDELADAGVPQDLESLLEDAPGLEAHPSKLDDLAATTAAATAAQKGAPA